MSTFVAKLMTATQNALGAWTSTFKYMIKSMSCEDIQWLTHPILDAGFDEVYEQESFDIGKRFPSFFFIFFSCAAIPKQKNEN